jgi:hypothetical protein
MSEDAMKDRISAIKAGLSAMREVSREYGFFELELIEQVEAELRELKTARARVSSRERCQEEMRQREPIR